MEETIQKKAHQFEEEIRNFLERMKFSDINGGSRFIINGKQVDVVAGHENTLLIFEVTTKRNIRDKIEIFRGNIPLLKEGFSNHKIYGKYKDFKFILVTNLREINDQDKEFASKNPQIIIWDRKFLDYYMELYEVIREYAKYNLLGELGIKPFVSRPLIYPAMKTHLNGYTVYNFFVDPKELLKVSYVARREIGKEEYYQRMVKKSRIKKISDFINNGGMFPNNIIICFEKEPEFTKIRDVENVTGYDWPQWLEFGILKFPNDYRSAWIIDGQHRLYAFSRTSRNPYIAVLAFHTLEKERQAGFFIEINKEQKPVDSNLLWDLEGEMRPKTERGIISNIVKELNKREPFEDMIYIPLEGVGKRGKLKLTTFCTVIEKRRLSKVTTESKVENPLYDDKDYTKTVKNVADALSEYFLKLKTMFSDEVNNDFIFTNAGISVMTTIYERIIERTKKKPSLKDIEKYIKPLVDYLNSKTSKDLKDLRQRCTSEAGKHSVFEDFAIIIQKVDEKFAPDVKLPYYEELKSFEKNIRNTVIKTLMKVSKNWLKENIPPDVLSNAQRKMKQHRGKNIYDFFDLGDCIKIIESKKNWPSFEPIFVNEKYGFLNKQEFLVAMRKIKHYRDAAFHRELEFGFEDEKIFISYLKKIKKCIEENKNI